MKTLITALLLAVSTIALAERSTIVKGKVITESQWIEAMPAVASNYSAKLPSMIDSVTMLMSLRANHNTFTYVYTLDRAGYAEMIYGEKAELTQEAINYGKNIQNQILVNIYCTNPSLKHWRKLGTKLKHVYSDTVGKHIMTIKVNPDTDCPLEGGI